ncbi:RNA polymerase II elongation factor Ell [Copidosoma floridanum]|uniref:RNA polymerase II elongation factor Ell n=1 Tax=Copidosoma floridanum TaxID=29053 RepID=UPI0006C9801E|nr:RNA polymerase II elongation factor Ell [Copidosoma floridanum]
MNLESLGALPCKMRIQANDDVYETTRHRMHAAEENNKNKCTRVIKANEPVGRKVKVKGKIKSNSSSNVMTSNLAGKQRDFISTNPVHNSFKPSFSCKYVQNNLVNNRIPNENLKKLSEVMRKPLKERLVHLLALRPFKRPELYDRINKEGVREKEKNIMANLLKQIAFMRDNTYHLNRCMWNDVQEDWPFYTEQEKAILKRRRPENLTPPGSSDGGSSGSGQSPNSIHPGSPPTVTALPFDVFGTKRPGYYQGNDGLPTKRQRISHYRKNDPDVSYSACDDSTKLNITANINTVLDEKQHRKDDQFRYHEEKSLCIIEKLNDFISSDTDDLDSTTVTMSNKRNIVNNNVLSIQNSYQAFDGIDHSNENLCQFSEDDLNNYREKTVTNYNGLYTSVSKECVPTNSLISNQQNYEEGENNVEGDILNVSEIRISNQFHSGNETDSFLTISTSHTFPEFPHDLKYSDYSNHYTTIHNLEQRTQYKAEFNAYYKEYRKLHVQVVQISKQFSQLKDRLEKKSYDGNMEGYEKIKAQILEEYAKTKNINARFYYLHGKLGYIKKLVSDYDAYTNRNSSNPTENKELSSLDIANNTFDYNIEESNGS